MSMSNNALLDSTKSIVSIYIAPIRLQLRHSRSTYAIQKRKVDSSVILDYHH